MKSARAIEQNHLQQKYYLHWFSPKHVLSPASAGLFSCAPTEQADQRAHAVSAHVAEGHGGGLIRILIFRLCELLHTRSGDLRANHLGAKLDTDVCSGDDPMAMIPSN